MSCVVRNIACFAEKKICVYSKLQGFVANVIHSMNFCFSLKFEGIDKASNTELHTWKTWSLFQETSLA